MNVLVLNAGSSTLKFRLLKMAGARTSGETELADGLVEKWGTSQASLRLEIEGRPAERRSVAAETPSDAAAHAIEASRPLGIDAVGHRVVHGGWKYQQPVRVTQDVIQGIGEVLPLAPLHNGLALAGIEAARRLLPQVPSVAVFDTAFHRTIPDVAALYAIPTELSESQRLRRYGFHGISHEFVCGRLLECMGRAAAGTRLITCHLGNGASLCAIRDGKSVDTSMGLTPVEGLVMGTRSGDIDPGLLIHLMRTLDMSAPRLDDLLNHRSGLLGVSGRSPDMREIEQAAAVGDGRARLAIEMFTYRARKYIGAYAAALGGVDAIAFSAGIGEHSPSVRARICEGLGFLKAELDAARNRSAPANSNCRISTDSSAVQLWIIPTNEELQIAREVRELIGGD